MIFLVFAAVFVLIYISLGQLNPREKFESSKFNTPIHRLDYLDDDILRMYGTNLSQCVEMCGDDDECKGFVYVPRDELCKFKATFEKPTFSRGHISFLKKN